MFGRKFLNPLMSLIVIASLVFGGGIQAQAQNPAPAPASPGSTTNPSSGFVPNDQIGTSQTMGQMRTTTNAMRIAAGAKQGKKGVTLNFGASNWQNVTGLSPEVLSTTATMAAPNSSPDFFAVGNFANSPLPQLDSLGNVLPSTGIRKFIDTLPGMCGISPWGTLGANSLGQCLPVAVADTTSFPGSDYYEIGLVEYREQMSPDLPGVLATDANGVTSGPTKLRGYVQLVSSTFPGAVPLDTAHGLTVALPGLYGATKPHYLGPLIIAHGCDLQAVSGVPSCVPTPVRVKFRNLLPTGTAGNLFIPTDSSYMGAGMGPGGSITHINVTTPGAGYLTAPAVTFTAPPAGGTAPAATASVLNGGVASIKITNGGAGYLVNPTVTVAAPPCTINGTTCVRALATAVYGGKPGDTYSENRATLHLHGGNTPWISDGTPHQWTTPAGEITSYSRGESVSFVPDMWFDSTGALITAAGCQGQTNKANCPGGSNDPGPGALTFFWTNQQSGRLMFFHDHSYGVTRLNVEAGEAAGYLLVDNMVENTLAAAGVPGTMGTAADTNHLVPLIIQDKTFVSDNGVTGGQLAAQDPTWDLVKYGGAGSLWFPHVYMPNQNPADVTGANAYGRWDYGPWFWPAQNPATFVPGGQPYSTGCTTSFYTATNPGPAFPPLVCPGTPLPSGTPEAFLDTPVVNGALYPSLTVDPTAYRFQILNAANDRTLNLSWFLAEPLSVAVTNGGTGYATGTTTVSFSGGVGPTDATAHALVSGGAVTGAVLAPVGAGYTTAPSVLISGDGTGAKATATVDPITTSLTAITITNIGSGYTTATISIAPPTSGCVIDGSTCIQALATATLTGAGTIISIIVDNPGSSAWTAAPSVVIAGAGSGAVAIASVNTEVKMVDAATPVPSSPLQPCTLSNVDNALGPNLGQAQLNASGNPINGTGIQTNCWPDSWPTDVRAGGVPDPRSAGPAWVQIGTEGGKLPSAVVIPPTPVGYEYNRRSITVLNIFNNGLLLGPAERADTVVDFSQFAGKTLILYNDAGAPVPAFDSRTDYYTGDPDQTTSGGAPTTLPGYGPNTRTIMQVKVGGTVNGTAFNVAPVSAALAASWAANEDKVIIPESAFPAGNGGSATDNYTRIQDNYINGWFGNPIGAVTLTNGGSGYSAAPLVSFARGAGDTTGGGATAVATISGFVKLINVSNPGSGYLTLPAVTITGTGTGATASTTALKIVGYTLNGGRGYNSATCTVSGGGQAGTCTAVVNATTHIISSVTVTPTSGWTSRPTIAISAPNGVAPRSQATATANMGVATIAVTANGANFTTAPTVAIAAPTGTPAILAQAAATISGSVTSVTLTNGGNGYTATPTVVFTPVVAGVGSGAAASVSSQHVLPKTIQELFTLDYGRMNATLGVEIPFTSFTIQTTIPYGYVEPPTELFSDGETQIWKITHNGVDTHFIHFHLFNVQVINRVGWDGAIKPPEANEIGWKDTVRMNPLEDVIVALRSLKQVLPAGWDLPDSQRALDVTTPIGSTNPMQFSGIDPMNNPAPVTNDVINFGYEYVWHCHILGHEENDMMRAMMFGVPPAPVTNLSVTVQPILTATSRSVKLQWTDNSAHETGFTVQRTISAVAPIVWTDSFQVPAMPGSGGTVTWYDTNVAKNTTYYYQVIANNVVGDTAKYAAPAVGYPWASYDSPAVQFLAGVMTNSKNGLAPWSGNPVFIFASNFEVGLGGWSSVSGNVTAVPWAPLGPSGFKLGMAADLGVSQVVEPSAAPAAAFVQDASPANKTSYDAHFWFNPNGSDTGTNPIDIFVGLDAADQQIFGVQYQLDQEEMEGYQARSWSMQNGAKVFTPWVDITNDAHYFEVAWQSGVGFSFYQDDFLVGSATGIMSQTLSKVNLGPSSGMSDFTSGTLYFDEFSSSSVNGVTYNTYLPAIMY